MADPSLAQLGYVCVYVNMVGEWEIFEGDFADTCG